MPYVPFGLASAAPFGVICQDGLTLRRDGTVVGDGTWLRMAEVVARLRAAGYQDSESTVRRMIDAGELRVYRSRLGGHRRILAASVDALIEQRRSDASGAKDTENGESPPA